jgi:hypothetical protein
VPAGLLERRDRGREGDQVGRLRELGAARDAPPAAVLDVGLQQQPVDLAGLVERVEVSASRRAVQVAASSSSRSRRVGERSMV